MQQLGSCGTMQEATGATGVQLQRSHTAGELKRSNNMTGGATAHRPTSHHQSRSRRSTGSGGSKPTLEIYRPPNVRVDGSHMNGEGNKLNVHAKEFTMQTGDLKTSRSSGNILAMNSQNANLSNNYNNNNTSNNNNNIITSAKASKSALLQQSKSSGNILHALQHHQQHQQQQQQQLRQQHQVAYQTTSTGNVLQQSHRVHFRFEAAEGLGAAHASHAEGYGVGCAHAQHAPRARAAAPPRGSTEADEYQPSKPLRSKTQAAISTGQSSGGIKRSKSMGSTDALGAALAAKDLPDFANFPSEVQAAIHRAVDDPNQVSARTLMQLVRHIMDKVVESRSSAEPAAKLCITIIEKEKNETFLESLLNTCQLWYQNREKYLKITTGSTGMRYPAFMAFLNEMYCQLKRRQLQLKTQYDGVAPGLLILTLLAKCCQECLKPPAVNSLKEMECLFFVLSSIGRDLETELPARMNAVLAGVRDAFLTTAVVPAIRKTLLQLIELHAAQWQLPAPAIMYYYPATNK